MRCEREYMATQGAKHPKPKSAVPPDSPAKPQRAATRRRRRFAWMIGAICFVLAAGAFAAFWKAYLGYALSARRGVRAYDARDYTHAERLLANALETSLSRCEKAMENEGEAKARRIWERYQISAVANKLGLTYLELGRHDLLESMYSTRMAPAIVRLHGERSPSLVPCYDVLAQSLTARGDFDRAEEFYREMVDILSRAYGPEDRRMILALGHYARMLNLAGRDADALKLSQEAKRIEALQ